MLMAVSATATTPLVSNGLVLYFGFDGMTAGPRGVVDGSPNGADGTVVRGCYEELGIRGTGVRIAEAVLNNFNPKDLNGDGLAGGADDTWTYTNVLPTPYDPDVEPEDNAWLESGTEQDPYRTPVNRDYNYIWMLPSDISNIPTDGFTEAVWVKAENKYYTESTDTDPCALWNACGYNGNTTQRPDHREFLEHLEIKSDGYRTTLRTNAMLDIIAQNPMKNLSGKNIPSDKNMGVWTHLAWTYDTHVWNGTVYQAVVKFYLNGVLQRAYTQNDVPSTVLRNASLVGNWDWGVRLGCNVDNARQFQGLMDELYIYDRPLSAADILVLAGLTGPETPLPGDANLDRVVDDKDASILAANWLVAEDATWFMGDFNQDGAVDDEDAAILAANRGQPLPAPWAGVAVPEPSTVVLLWGALASLVAVRLGGIRPCRGNGARARSRLE
jgi:hypothetical protein